MKNKINLSVDDDVAIMLRRTGNASGYVSEVARQRHLDLQVARLVLAHAGVAADWGNASVMAALSCVPSVPLVCSAAVAVGLALRDEWERTGDETVKRVMAAATDESVARALAFIAAEYWAGNDLARPTETQAPAVNV